MTRDFGSQRIPLEVQSAWPVMRRFRHAGSTVIEPIPNGGLEGFKASCLAAWDAKPVILNGGMGCHASQSDWKLKRLAYVPDLLIDGMTWHGDHADWRDQQEISLEDNQHGGHPATIIIWLKPRSIQSTV